MSPFAARIKAFCEYEGLYDYQFGERVGVSRAAISNLMTGRSRRLEPEAQRKALVLLHNFESRHQVDGIGRFPDVGEIQPSTIRFSDKAVSSIVHSLRATIERLTDPISSDADRVAEILSLTNTLNRSINRTFGVEK